MTPPTNEPSPNCTLAICSGTSLCGASKSIGIVWSTFQLKVQLRANDVHTISFVTTCVAPAYVALRNLVLPGSDSTAARVTSTLILATTLPAELSTATMTERLTVTEATISISSREWSTATITQISTVTETQSLPSSSAPTTEPFPSYSVPINKRCKDAGPVLVSAPGSPDFMVLDNLDMYNWEASVPVVSSNFSLTFTPLDGRQLCTFHLFDEYYHCDWLGLPQTILSREYLTLSCPENENSPVAPPDTSYGTSTVNLQIVSNCPYIVKQIGCFRYQDCIVDAYLGATPSASFEYPYLARMRLKAVGSGWTRALCSVAYTSPDYGGPVSYEQWHGEFIDITLPTFANVGDIQVTVECQTVKEVPASSDCQFPVLFGKPSAQDSQIIQPYSASSLDLSMGDTTAASTTVDGQSICARNQQTDVQTCGHDTISVGPFETTDSHAFQLSCPDGSPAAVDLSGPAMNVELQTSYDVRNVALQIGCETGAPCNAFHVLEGAMLPYTISARYPLTTPTTRLRVKVFGAVPPSHLSYATWSVTISDAPAVQLKQENGQWLEIDAPSDATSVVLNGIGLYDSTEPSAEPTGEPNPEPAP